jgi:hypothetical protein
MTRIVAAGSLVVGARVIVTTLGLHALLETTRTSSAVLNHTVNLVIRAGGDRVLAGGIVASMCAFVALHQARVVVSEVGGLDTDTALAFLHHDRHDVASVHVALLGDRLDSFLNVGGLFGGVVVSPTLG